MDGCGYSGDFADAMSCGQWGGCSGSYVNLGDTCTGPDWYDFMVEGVGFFRDMGAQGVRDISSQGIRGAGPPNTVLGRDSFDTDWAANARFSLRYQTSAVHDFEATYLANMRFVDRATFTSANNDIYSVFSDFGNDPAGGYEETGQAFRHTIAYESQLEGVELNSRRSWTMAGWQVHGSWLIGLRYLHLDESFQYLTEVQPHFDPINQVARDAASMDYLVTTNNDLLGPQFGGEFTRSFFPGLIGGMQFKTGIYGNSASQRTRIVADTLVPSVVESFKDEDVAFIGEFRTYMIYQFHPLWKIRAGYELLWLSGVALANENFNTQSPFEGVSRDLFLNASGDVLYQGVSAGLEFGW